MMMPTRPWLAICPEMMAVFDDKLSCRDMSNSLRLRLGLSDKEKTGLPLARMIDLDADPELKKMLAAVMRGQRVVHGRTVELAGGDEESAARLSAWKLQSDTDLRPSIVLYLSDAAELGQAMRDLSRVQSAHQLILTAAGEGIYGLDANGKITFGNAASAEILGWQVDEILGQRAHDVHHHSHPDGSPYARTDCPIYAALKDGEVHRVDDEVFWHTDGSAVPVEYTSTPILKDGKPSGAVVLFRDISERREIERQREAAYAEVNVLTRELEQERDYLREEVKVSVKFCDIIGQSPALMRTLAKVEAVASTNANVLVLGESGVGKEMIARAIHTQSARAGKPLIKVNCASIPNELFESEFFGHVRGAFTGAHQDRVGRMQLACGGTLFLDEIGEIPLALQGKLLRALQEREFERVGDDTTIKADVRVVAATNRDLEAEVAAGRFREDLYYRLSVFPVSLPPLRERVGDIVPLATHFLDEICAELGRDTLSLTKQQATTLKKHAWPGNIRELRNVIERAVILTRGKRLRLDLAISDVGKSDTGQKPTDAAGEGYLTEVEFREKEKQNLLAVLRSADGRVWGPDGAAAMLGIKPSTFSYRMKALGILQKRGQVSDA